MREAALLPPGTRLVHIGPHKTGTTALQQALHQARDLLREHGVRYGGTGPQAYRQAIGLTGKRGQLGDDPPAEEDWLGLVAEARAAGEDRWVVSSESFANAGPQHVRRLAEDLGPQVHVVRMVRRYDKLVASQWQQSVAAGQRHTLGEYLATVTTDPEAPFWRRHGFVPLTRRWADGVGHDHLSVVVVDEDDHGWLLRVVERMLGLDEGLLVLPTGGGGTNRSLTAAEVELVRRLNRIRVAQGWTGRSHLEFVRRGVAPALRQLAPDPQDGRIELPAHLGQHLRERTTADLAELAGLERLGVAVVGDPTWLVVPDDAAAGDSGAASGVPAAGTLRVDSVVRAARRVVERHLSGVSFPLEGAGPSLADPRGVGRRRRLTAAERSVVAELEQEPWPAEVVERFVRRGLARWLRRSGAGPGPDASTDDPGRLDPARAAVALSGVIAQTDPAAVADEG